MTRLSEEQKLDLLKDEMKLCQGQVDKYDNILERVNTWVVTLWAASLGWAFQMNSKEFVALNIVIVLVFWVLQGINKAFRQDYKDRRDEVAHLLNRMGKEGVAPSEIVSPRFPTHKNLWRNTLSDMFKPHSALIYLVLAVVSAAIYVRF